MVITQTNRASDVAFVAIVMVCGKNVLLDYYHFMYKNKLEDSRPLHSFRRHLGCGAVAAKITANV